MFCFLIQYEMEWKPIWSDSSARWMRPCETSGLTPNRSAQNYTKTSHLISREMKVSWGVKGKLYFLTSEHPKNCIYVTLVMKRPSGLWEGFYHLRCCLWTDGIQHRTFSPRNVILRVKFLSNRLTLISSGELENELSQPPTIIHSFHVSFFSQLFF